MVGKGRFIESFNLYDAMRRQLINDQITSNQCLSCSAFNLYGCVYHAAVRGSTLEERDRFSMGA
jgi:hypothetical protein